MMMQNLSLQKGYTKERSHRLKKEILATSNEMFRLWGVNKQIRESIGHYLKEERRCKKIKKAQQAKYPCIIPGFPLLQKSYSK